MARKADALPSPSLWRRARQRNDGGDLAVLVQLEVGQRMQLGVDVPPTRPPQVSTRCRSRSRAAITPPGFLAGLARLLQLHRPWLLRFLARRKCRSQGQSKFYAMVRYGHFTGFQRLRQSRNPWRSAAGRCADILTPMTARPSKFERKRRPGWASSSTSRAPCNLVTAATRTAPGGAGEFSRLVQPDAAPRTISRLSRDSRPVVFHHHSVRGGSAQQHANAAAVGRELDGVVQEVGERCASSCRLPCT